MDIEYLRVRDTIDLLERRLPLITVQGREPGAVVWLTANVHGDEVIGIAVIHRVLAWLRDHELLRGTVYALPSLNPSGHELGQRTIPLDSEDMNRAYPGDPAGTIAKRTAYLIYERIIQTRPDLVIDLHTMTFDRTLAYVLLDRLVGNPPPPDLKRRMEEMAEVFGLTVVYDLPIPQYKAEGLEGSLSGALLNRDHILSITLELGPPDVIVNEFVEIGVNGVLNCLKKLNMIAGEFPDHPSKIESAVPMRRSSEIRANHSGILHYHANLGDRVEKGQLIAEIHNLLGETVERMEAPCSGYVLYLGGRDTVFPGAEVMTLAIPEQD